MNGFIIGTLQFVTTLAWLIIVGVYAFVGYQQGPMLAYEMDMDYQMGQVLGLGIGLVIGVIFASIVVGVIILLIEIRKELQAMRGLLASQGGKPNI